MEHERGVSGLSYTQKAAASVRIPQKNEGICLHKLSKTVCIPATAARNVCLSAVNKTCKRSV